MATEQERWQRLADGLGVPLEDYRLRIFDAIGAQIEGDQWDPRARRRLGESLANSSVSRRPRPSRSRLRREQQRVTDHDAAFVIVSGMHFSAVAIEPTDGARVTFLPDAKFVWAAMRRGASKA